MKTLDGTKYEETSQNYYKNYYNRLYYIHNLKSKLNIRTIISMNDNNFISNNTKNVRLTELYHSLYNLPF